MPYFHLFFLLAYKQENKYLPFSPPRSTISSNNLHPREVWQPFHPNPHWRRGAPPRPHLNRHHPIDSLPGQSPSHPRLRPNHHLPGKILLQRLRTRLGPSCRIQGRGRKTPTPHGRILETNGRRVPLPPNAHHRRRAGHAVAASLMLALNHDYVFMRRDKGRRALHE
ncbi:hypothetical protein SLEP1_g43329 [Rubroshorea leprosula]|uniref:Uncharacterized protein n=1 Tax=Rubroshorea leprosula TaxID=152421 RepID=A0AAV5LE66_9ROSI|nr:hypothetical protein SLEP1_g43329 [Rubroshorea leprosula]